MRDTLEQIDTARLLIEEYSDVSPLLFLAPRTPCASLKKNRIHQTFELVSNAREWSDAMRRGKIASMLGVEG